MELNQILSGLRVELYQEYFSVFPRVPTKLYTTATYILSDSGATPSSQVKTLERTVEFYLQCVMRMKFKLVPWLQL